MRNIKTLLEILLYEYQSNQDEDIRRFGLCWAIVKLRNHDVVKFYEMDILLDVIEANKPDTPCSGTYWWPKGEVEPRVEFLKQLIMKYETQCQSK